MLINSTSTEANKPLCCVWIEEWKCEDLRKWMCEDLRRKCEESECVWIEVC